MKRNHVDRITRQQAAMVCQARASITPAQWPVSDNDIRASLGVGLPANGLAGLAWHHVMSMLDWPDDFTEDYHWAEAESLLRDGWTPRYWRPT